MHLKISTGKPISLLHERQPHKAGILEGGGLLIVDRASPSGLTAVYLSRNHLNCSVVVHSMIA